MLLYGYMQLSRVVQDLFTANDLTINGPQFMHSNTAHNLTYCSLIGLKADRESSVEAQRTECGQEIRQHSILGYLDPANLSETPRLAHIPHVHVLMFIAFPLIVS